MEHPDYNSAIALKTFLEENGMAMQKKFGQNFMLNPQARTKIIDYLDPEENQVVWEIGPGLGCMTSEILSRKACLTAFEIDRGFISFLHQFLMVMKSMEISGLLRETSLRHGRRNLNARKKDRASCSEICHIILQLLLLQIPLLRAWFLTSVFLPSRRKLPSEWLQSPHQKTILHSVFCASGDMKLSLGLSLLQVISGQNLTLGLRLLS